MVLKLQPPTLRRGIRKRRGAAGLNLAVAFGMTASDDENLGFDMANMHKRFVSLNLKSEKGLEVMHKLLADADIFITNNRTKSLLMGAISLCRLTQMVCWDGEGV